MFRSPINQYFLDEIGKCHAIPKGKSVGGTRSRRAPEELFNLAEQSELVWMLNVRVDNNIGERKTVGFGRGIQRPIERLAEDQYFGSIKARRVVPGVAPI